MNTFPRQLTHMRNGDEAFTTMAAVHPDSSTIELDAPLYTRREDNAVILVSRDRNGDFHVWGHLSPHYPEPRGSGYRAIFHLSHYAETIDIEEQAAEAWA